MNNVNRLISKRGEREERYIYLYILRGVKSKRAGLTGIIACPQE